ncbi:MAG: HAD-IIB family hydrolase [Nanoarchaeota archaeon]|nr:HAD-IIB family hydrolase [Nanoarchaeota archaeon]
MAKIDLVFNDIDGCFGNFKKPKTYPEKQSLAGHEGLLAKIKAFVEAHPDVKFSACTGRSLYLCDNIIEATGMNEVSAVEMGQEIYHPLTGECYGLLAIVRQDLAAVGTELKSFIANASSFEDEIKAALSNSEIKQMKDNRKMLTYEFKAAADGGVTGEQVYDFLNPRLPESVKAEIAAGGIKIVVSKNAIDVRPSIGKGEAIEHILEKLKRANAGCLGIGDSYHSDIDMMQRCEHVACPANTDEKLKDYVSQRKGHIAKQPFGEGVLEIYRTLI